MSDPMQKIRPMQNAPVFSKQDFLANHYAYSDWNPYEQGYLDVGDGHQLFYQVGGNPEGIPVVALHGGPGAGSKPIFGEYFDPNVYKIILFDQRGAGNSLPFAEVENNTIEDLVSDISTLKKHLDIKEPWSIYSLSWGTALAQHYATAHPEEVDTLFLDASCFSDQPNARWLVDPTPEWLQEGSAEQQRMKADAYDEYVDFIKHAEFLGDDEQEREKLNKLPLSQAYYHCLRGDYGHEVAVEAATRFMVFDMKLLSPDLTDDSPEIQGARDAAEGNLALSRLFYHFYVNEYDPEGPDSLINKMAEKWDGKTVMIHGSEDIVTPIEVARLLEDKLAAASKPPAFYSYGNYGHTKVDKAALRATRQVLQEETYHLFEKRGQSYEDMMLQRIKSLQDKGLNVDLSTADIKALRDNTKYHRLSTGGLSPALEAFVTVSKGMRKKGSNYMGSGPMKGMNFIPA